jgi:glyoxylase-like metal-dependent hydrolase (beta-lactamase superfamily II)
MASLVIAAVRELGFRGQDIHCVIFTHIHLDHAGASGWLVKRLPHLRICAHELGCRHPADPSWLLKSAGTVCGSMENVLQVHGEILPGPRENLVAVKDYELKVSGERQLRTRLGHSQHA